MGEVRDGRVRNHWYWRPGWGVGSRFYTWHLTFDGQQEVTAFASHYRKTLAMRPELDVVPDAWLHLTMQGVGFADQVSTDDVDAIVAGARRRCADMEPLNLTIGAPHVDPESIQIGVQPTEEVRRLRAQLRAAIGDVWGDGRVPEATEPYTPHLSLAYINADGPAGPLSAALEAADPASATATITTCQLIVLNRDEAQYVWHPHATVDLGHR